MNFIKPRHITSKKHRLEANNFNQDDKERTIEKVTVVYFHHESTLWSFSILTYQISSTWSAFSCIPRCHRRWFGSGFRQNFGIRITRSIVGIKLSNCWRWVGLRFSLIYWICSTWSSVLVFIPTRNCWWHSIGYRLKCPFCECSFWGRIHTANRRRITIQKPLQPLVGVWWRHWRKRCWLLFSTGNLQL